MMVNRLAFSIAFCVFVYSETSLAQTDDTCKTHADCKGTWFHKFCCGGESNNIDRTKRMCRLYNCLDKYCATQSDCGDPMLCCHSHKCVDANHGCFGCTSNADCTSDHVCCERSFSSNQAFCAKDCVGAHCNNNDDCAGEGECCRDGRCINTGGCHAQCKSNLECDAGKYCCKKKSVWFWQDRCKESCVGEVCSTDDDCGPQNECCIYGKCAKECTSDPDSCKDCTSDHVCCKRSFPSNQAFCAQDCVGAHCNNNDDCAGEGECCRDGRCINAGGCHAQCKSNLECDAGKYCCKKKSVWFWQDRCNESCVGEVCSTDDDCGPQNECCISGKCAGECVTKDTISVTKTSSKKSLPTWLIPVIVTVVLLIAVGVSIAAVLFWYFKRKRASNITQVNRESSLNTQSQGTIITSDQFIGLNNPIQQQQGTSVVGLDLSTNHQEQNEYNAMISKPAPPDDGYVNPLHSLADQACENLHSCQVQQRDGLRFCPQAS